MTFHSLTGISQIKGINKGLFLKIRIKHLIDSCHQFTCHKVLGTVDPQWKGYSQYEVRQGQVEKAYISHGFQLYVPKENPENSDITCEINYKY